MKPRHTMNDLILKPTSKGNGVFANRNFKKGEFIIQFSGKTYSKSEYKTLINHSNNHFLQIDSETFIGPSGNLDDLINHSCNPNCGVIYTEKEIRLYSIQKIKKGEEICFDYSTTMAEDFWEMECLCGSHKCRKVIRDFRHLPRKLKEKYISLGIVPAFVHRKIK